MCLIGAPWRPSVNSLIDRGEWHQHTDWASQGKQLNGQSKSSVPIVLCLSVPTLQLSLFLVKSILLYSLLKFTSLVVLYWPEEAQPMELEATIIIKMPPTID